MALLSADDMVALMKKSLDLEERHYKMLLLFGLHVRIGIALQPDFCIYVNLVGPKQCGKTHVTKYVTEMCNGKFISRATNAYILRKMGKLNATGTLLGIDQLEERFKNNEDADLQDVLETGHTWSAEYGLTEKVKNKIQEIEIGCGGPKIFNTLIPPRPTLRSRTYEIEVYATDKSDCIVNYTQRADDIKKISESLDEYANTIKVKFNIADERVFLRSQTHQDKVALLNKTVGGRRAEMFNAFELCRVYASGIIHGSWDIDVASNLSYETADDDEDVFRRAVHHAVKLNMWGNSEVSTADFSKAMVVSLREYGMNRMSPNELGRWMTNTGFGKPPYRIHKEGGNYYCFNLHTMSRLSPSPIIQMTLPDSISNNASGMRQECQEQKSD